ncbi:MAG: helix-turn-helix domain-containing protein [Dehalococcoidia bacterium]
MDSQEGTGWRPGEGVGATGLPFQMQRDMAELADALGADATLDVQFLAYLLRFARFGFFTFGPVTIDVRLIEDVVERTAPRRTSEMRKFADDFVAFSRVLMDELRRSGRKRVDELHYLLAFMRCNDGLPGRVFSELGITPEAVEEWVRQAAQGRSEASLERLFSPEEAAEYLGVHVQTVRAWIRSGRLPASRLAGQRALRILASDLRHVLEPVSAEE